MPNALGRDMTDRQLDELLTDAIGMATRQRTLREMLALATGGGATVVRIHDVQTIFGWRNDPPMVGRPDRPTATQRDLRNDDRVNSPRPS
jgi:hypothetical protein